MSAKAESSLYPIGSGAVMLVMLTGQAFGSSANFIDTPDDGQVILTVTATNSLGTGTFELINDSLSIQNILNGVVYGTIPDVDADGFRAAAAGGSAAALPPIQIVDPNNSNVVASIDGISLQLASNFIEQNRTGTAFDIAGITFSAAAADTTFTIESARLAYDETLTDRIGAFTANYVADDIGGGGVSLTPANTSGFITDFLYESPSAVGEQVFDNFGTGIFTDGGSNEQNNALLTTPIGVPVSSVFFRTSFTLSAGDQASIEQSYSVVIPAPGAASMMIFAGGMLARRRRA